MATFLDILTTLPGMHTVLKMDDPNATTYGYNILQTGFCEYYGYKSDEAQRRLWFQASPSAVTGIDYQIESTLYNGNNGWMHYKENMAGFRGTTTSIVMIVRPQGYASHDYDNSGKATNRQTLWSYGLPSSSASARRIELYVQSDGRLGLLYMDKDSFHTRYVTNNFIIPEDKETMVVGTFEAGSIKLYVNQDPSIIATPTYEILSAIDGSTTPPDLSQWFSSITGDEGYTSDWLTIGGRYYKPNSSYNLYDAYTGFYTCIGITSDVITYSDFVSLNNAFYQYEEDITTTYQTRVTSFGAVNQYKCDDIAGPIVDSSNGLDFPDHASITHGNLPLLASQPTGTSLEFDGTGSTTTASDLSFSGADPRSFCFWIKPGTVTGTECIMVSGSGATDSYFAICLTNGVLELIPWGSAISSGASLTLNETHFCVVTYDGANLRFYVDGVLVDTTYKILNTTASPLTLGGTTVGGLDYFTGLIDDVTVFDYALSDGHVTVLYDAGIQEPDPSSSYTTTVAGVVRAGELQDPVKRKIIGVSWASIYQGSQLGTHEYEVLGETYSDETTGNYILDVSPYTNEVMVIAQDDYGDAYKTFTTIQVDDVIHPQDGFENGYVYVCTVAGVTDGTLEPAWWDTDHAQTTQQLGSASFAVRPYYRPLCHGPVKPLVTIVSNDAYKSAILSSTPILYLTFDLGDESDSSSAPKTVLVAGAPTWDEPQLVLNTGLSKAVRFTGSSYLTCDEIAPSLGSSYSIEFWMQTTSTASGYGEAIISCHNASSSYANVLRLVQDGNTVGV
jgi:hypothetical protein